MLSANLDMSSPEPVTAKLESSKIPRISSRIRTACDLLSSGACRTIKAAAARANLSREHLSRSLRKNHVRAYIEEKTRSELAIATLRAVARLNELGDAKSEAGAAG